MAYEKQNFTDGQVLTADHLNHIEEGIENATQDITAESLGAAVIDDSAVGSNAWSSKNTVDKLCPSFTESGTVVTCEPVEGYPLEVVSSIVSTQSGTGTPAPDNVRPISGYAKIEVTRSGKNLAAYPYKEKTKTVNGITFTDNGDGSITIDGTATANATYFFANQQPWNVKKGASYTAKLHKVSGSYSGTNPPAWEVNYNYSATSGDDWGWMEVYPGTQETKPCPERMVAMATYLVVKTGTTCNNLVVRPQLEAGTEATAYEPYAGEGTFTTNLGQTVYGGTYNWSTGELTISLSSLVLDGSSTGKNVLMTDPGAKTYAYFRFSAGKPSGSCRGDRAYCSLNYGALVITIPTSISGVTDSDTDAQVVSKINAVLKTWYEAGTPLTIVYELATPATVQMAPQQILALSSTNTVFSSTGDTTVTGRSNPTAIINKLTNAIVALGGTV